MRLRPVLAVSLVLTGLMVLPSNAGCGVGGIRGRDPGQAALNAEIDRAAARRKVPPVLLKAIAWHESRWRQFYSDGSIVLSGSCAIGVMQVLASGGFSAYKLATDYRYNIDAGALVLAGKMSASSANVPRSLGPDERRVTENWYRATYRYNGAGYRALKYADAVFAAVRTPPSEISRWTVAVPVSNPRHVLSGYSPTTGHSYVARLDGTWVSTLGTKRYPVVRADILAGATRISPGRTLEGDQQAGAVFAARNIGWETWTTTRFSLSTSPIGRASRLRHPRWLSPTRPVGLAANTPTGAEGRFHFSVQAFNPTKPTAFSESFTPVMDGTIGLLGRSANAWYVNPAATPTASITSAPKYVTDASTDSTATVGLSFADPSPGSGIHYVEVSRRAPGATAWVTSRVLSSSVRLPFYGPGAHEVRVRAIDRAGHASAWTDPRAVVVPRDDTSATLTFAGDWTSSSVSGSWLGSLSSAPVGASVETVVNGTSYAVIGTRGPGLAPITVYLDGIVVTVIDPTAETTAQRQVLWSGPLSAGDHVLRLVVGDDTLPKQQADDQPALTGYLDAIAVS